MPNQKNETNATGIQLVSYSYQNNPIHFNIGSSVMISATNMARNFESHKRPVFWLNLQSTKDFVLELSKVRNLTLTDLVIVRKGGVNPGTWMHEDIALEYARWLSPTFGIWCNDRIKEILMGKSIPSPSRKYNRQKIDTYVSVEENNQLKQLCKTHGFSSTYQLLQHMIRNFLQCPYSNLSERIKQLEKEVEYYENDSNWWRGMAFSYLEMNKTATENLLYLSRRLYK